MLKILFVNLGNPCECLASTCVLKGLKECEITILVKNKDSASVFRFNQKIKQVLLINKLPNNFSNIKFDVLYNFHPDFDKNTIDVTCDNYHGFNFSQNSFEFEKIFYYDKKTNKNIFQLYYSLIDKIWKGQGLDFYYRPRNRSKKGRIGLAMTNIKLKDYIVSNLKENRLWNIPYKRNFLRKCDEINRCDSVITDDFYSMNVSLALNKEIFFLKTIDLNFKAELFGKGFIFKVPKNLL